ncbi:Protein disulfide-isomerase TMX3 [Echinococcus granulosus]|nr:Protein disulfide-isomerase TMX3 [Echinococcus granulosus]
MRFYCFLALLIAISFNRVRVYADQGSVVELDSHSFTKVISSPGGALVKFYAPWCGYCRQFEGPYSEAAHALSKATPNLIVARIDGTRFPAETSFSGVKGYPTVLLFKGNKSYAFSGERSVKGIISFVESVIGPPVEPLADERALERKVEELFDDVFFLHHGGRSSDLWSAFNATAEEYRLQLLFYHLDEEAPNHSGEVLVYKDGDRRRFQPQEGDLVSQLRSFIEENRQPAFGHLTAHDLSQMTGDLTSIVCVFLVDYISDSMKAFKYIGRDLAFKNSGDSSTVHFKFAWSVDTRGLSSLAMTSLEPPNLLLYYPFNQTFMLHPLYSTPEAISALDKQQIVTFLADGVNGKLPYYGGSGWLTSMRRFGFDLYSASMNLIQASPLIALVTFGIPLACLSCLVYCICCSHLDALDDAEGDLAAVGEARRARLLDREFVEAQLTSATYEDTIRARSIYSRFAERTRLSPSDPSESKPSAVESRKDR